jgi:histidinol phosphatase-like enzyme
MEKYIFLDFDGVLNTPKGKFDQKAIGKLRRLLYICSLLPSVFLKSMNRTAS